MLLVEEIVLENHLERRAVLDNGVVDGADLVRPVLLVAAEHLAYIDHHVDLPRALADSLLGLENLCPRRAAAVRKPDDGAYQHVRVL